MKQKNSDTPGPSGKKDMEENAKKDAPANKSNERQGKLPGEYPPNEDIMNRRDTQRVGIDVENFSRAIGIENYNKNEPIVTRPNDVMKPPSPRDVDELQNMEANMEQPVPENVNLTEDDLEIATGNESDVTAEDLQALGPRDLSMDMGEDEEYLKSRVWPVDMAGKDLDIPMGEAPDEDLDEAIGPEDEENDFYSLGGDRHDNLEDDPTAPSGNS